jgi:ketosteroid isomerase-like protein
MKIVITLLLSSFLLINCKQQPTVAQDKAAITAVLRAQQKAWSQGDLEAFMQGYWKSDSLKFYGSKGLTYGWDKTLANYKKGYPTLDHTGELQFVINDMTLIEENAYYVMGEYHLKRKVGNADGVFIIIFKRINGTWKIVADMSC